MTAEAIEQAPPITNTTKSSNKKGSLFGGKSKDHKKEGSDDGSVASTSSQKKTTNWLGTKVKRPRAEYQAEIDELKLKVASLEAQLERTSIDLQQFKDWVSMAPSAF